MRPVLTMLCVIAVITVVMASTVYPRWQTMREVEKILCDGELDWVYSIHPQFGSRFWAETPPRNDPSGETLSVQIHLDEMVLALTTRNTSVPVYEATPLAQWSPGLHALEWNTAVTIEDMALIQPCKDSDFGDQSSPLIDRLLDWFPGSESCKDVEDLCGHLQTPMLRLLCPRTCGCDSPRSGLLRHMGCPISCQRDTAYIAALGSTDCVDPPPEDLVSDPGWMRYWHSWQHIFSDLLDMSGEVVMSCQAAAPISFMFCDPNGRWYASIAAFCPVTCGCNSSSVFIGRFCPRSCEL